MTAPKVAIVIYSMYGHITKRMFAHPFCRRDSPRAHYLELTVAEAEKAGIESAGGKATIFQCVYSLVVVEATDNDGFMLIEFPRLFLRKSSPRCTLLPNLLTKSSPPRSSPLSMHSCSVFPPVTVTSQHSGRYGLRCFFEPPPHKPIDSIKIH
jgi:hypothetical protein